MGVSLMVLLAAISFGSVVGVSEGTQKDGRADLFASWGMVSELLTKGGFDNSSRPFLSSTHSSNVPAPRAQF